MSEYIELTIIPLIIAITEGLHLLGFDKKINGLIAVILGLITGLILTGVTFDGVVDGLIIGLSAVGLYSTGKNTREWLE